MKEKSTIIFAGIALAITTIIVVLSIIFTGSSDAKQFKKEYEELNGKTTSSGKTYRTIEIDSNNPFVYISLEDLNKKIEDKEDLIVYFGAWWCPWCRSVLPYAISEAKNNNIKKIYYVNVRPSLNEEDDIRDIYAKKETTDKKGKVTEELYLSHEGTESYHKFLQLADSVLKTYNNHGLINENAKRVGAPNFIMFKNGEAKKLITGVSSKQTDAYMDLTDEIIEDTKNIFSDFYKEFK